MNEKIINARNIFSRRVHRLRLDVGIDKKSLSKILGLSDTAISAYEDAKANPTLESLLRYSLFFDVSIDWLIGRTDLRRLPTEKNICEIQEIMLQFGAKLEIFKKDLALRDGE